MQISKYLKMKKSISTLLTIVFIASQVSAAPIQSSSRDTLATPLVSKNGIQSPRARDVQNGAAEMAMPDAIGNGKPLADLLAGKIPDQVFVKDSGSIAKKLKQAMIQALTDAKERKNKVPQEYQGEVDDAIKTLESMLEYDGNNKDFLNIHLFEAVVQSEEDYLLGFRRQEANGIFMTGLAIELVNSLPINLLAQYIFHEVTPEKEMVGREGHKEIYRKIQQAIFGNADVIALRAALRDLIDEISSGVRAEPWPNPDDPNVGEDKRIVMLISGGEAPGVNNLFASLAKKVAPKGYSVELVQYGLDGLIKSTEEFNGPEGAVRDVQGRKGVRVWLDRQRAKNIMNMPGSFVGTARKKLSDQKNLDAAINNLKGYCKTVVMIGGNDHLGEAGELAKALKDSGIAVLAFPKTIDGDTKVQPVGASSAGQYAHDLVMRAAPRPVKRPGEKLDPKKTRVHVIEMMGRDMGYLTVQASDMRPAAHPGYKKEQLEDMASLMPTMVPIVKEYNPSLRQVIERVRRSINDYGVATVVPSEGIWVPLDDEILAKVRKSNPSIDALFKEVDELRKAKAEALKAGKPLDKKYDDLAKVWLDTHDNLMLNKVGISRVISAAIREELGDLLQADDAVTREVWGYAIRDRMPNDFDRALTDDMTTKAADLITTDKRNTVILAQGGVCVAAKIGEGTDAKIHPLADVRGTVNLKSSGHYTEADLIEIGVVGVSTTEERPSIAIPAVRPAQPAGKNMAVIVDSINSMIESSLSLKRINLCVIPENDADNIIGILRSQNRVPISDDDAFVAGRTSAAAIFIQSREEFSLSKIVETVYDRYAELGFVNLVISGQFLVERDDPLLQVLEQNDKCKDIIKSAKDKPGEFLVFGRDLAELLIAALEDPNVLKEAGVGQKPASGIRKNIAGECFNLLPGEEKAKELPKVEDVIAQLRELKERRQARFSLGSLSKLDLSNIVVIMKEDLPRSVTGKKNNGVDKAVDDGCNEMWSKLRNLFPEGVIQVKDSQSLIEQMQAYIGAGKRVIILDDGTLMKAEAKDRIEKEVKKKDNKTAKPGEDYCVMSIPEKVEVADNLAIPFVNLNAMAMAGVGVLYRDTTLFETAYEAFTGKKTPQDVVDDVMNGARWIIRMIPRIVKFSDDIGSNSLMKKLVEAAA